MCGYFLPHSSITPQLKIFSKAEAQEHEIIPGKNRSKLLKPYSLEQIINISQFEFNIKKFLIRFLKKQRRWPEIYIIELKKGMEFKILC